MFRMHTLLKVGTLLKLLLLIFIVLSTAFLSTFTYENPAQADEISELNLKINKKEQEKAATLNKINELENKIQGLLNKKGDIEAKKTFLKELKADKLELDASIKKLDEQSTDQQKILDEYLIKVKENERDIFEQTNFLYKLSFNNSESIFQDGAQLKDFFNKSTKTNVSIDLFKQQVKEYRDRIVEAEDIKIKLKQDRDKIALTKQGIESKIVLLQKEVGVFESSLAATNKDRNVFSGKLSAIDKELNSLLDRQKALSDRESSLLNSNPSNGGTVTLKTGQIYFVGRGRDAMQGHGIGFSQYGAVGAALKGLNAEQIIKFYYPGVSISKMEEQDINVIGHGTMNINDYVSGIGEIPDKSCEDMGITYNTSNPYGFWTCWPKEVIIAKAIISRSYGWHYTRTRGTSICTTTSCQVYKGGTGKKWASEATRNLYIMNAGTVINAVYSADNNQGFGTANNDTVWSGYSGKGSTVSYMKSVNDTATTLVTPYSKWEWRTNGYSIAQINETLRVTSNLSAAPYRPYTTWLKDRLNEIGTITAFEVYSKDPSKRVKVIRLYGNKRPEPVEIAGWLFKGAWNEGRAAQGCSSNSTENQCDYIFSLTLDKAVK